MLPKLLPISRNHPHGGLRTKGTGRFPPQVPKPGAAALGSTPAQDTPTTHYGAELNAGSVPRTVLRIE